MNTYLKWACNTSWKVYSVSLASSLSHSLRQLFHTPSLSKNLLHPLPFSFSVDDLDSWLFEETDIIRWEHPHILTSICETYLCQYLFLHPSSCYLLWKLCLSAFKGSSFLWTPVPVTSLFQVRQAALSQISQTGEDNYRLVNPKCQKKQCSV